MLEHLSRRPLASVFWELRAFFSAWCDDPREFLDGQHLPLCHRSPLVPQGAECLLAQLGLYLLSELLIGAQHDRRHGRIESLAQPFHHPPQTCR